MIKLTLVKYIRQFSFKRVLTDYNHLFFQGIGLVLLSLVLVYLEASIYAWMFSDSGNWEYASFWERLTFILFKGKDAGIGTSVITLINFHLLVMVVIKLSKTKQLEGHSFSGRVAESYFYGLLVTMVTLVFLGNGTSYLFTQKSIFGEDFLFYNFFNKWLNGLLDYLLPFAGFYICLYFLRRGLHIAPVGKKFMQFLLTGFTYLVILTFTNFIVGAIVTLIVQPVGYIFMGSVVGIVLAAFMYTALLVFYMVAMSDLILVLLERKALPYTPPANPDLLDA